MFVQPFPSVPSSCYPPPGSFGISIGDQLIEIDGTNYEDSITSNEQALKFVTRFQSDSRTLTFRKNRLDLRKAGAGAAANAPWLVVVTDGADNMSTKWNPYNLSSAIGLGEVNLIILSVGVDDDMAKINMRTVVDSSVKGCVGELIDIASGEEIDKAFETINAIVGGHLQVQQY